MNTSENISQNTPKKISQNIFENTAGKLSANSPVILIENATKRYGRFTAVNQVSFAVSEGECCGLLGPNGAGKTSLARMIFGFSPLTEGKITVLGQDIRTQTRQIKARLGVVAQEDNLDPELTVRNNLLVYASYFSLDRSLAQERADEILRFMDLTEKANAIVDDLSGGMKRRLTIGRALINRPELLILDEPTTGLDPRARHLVWQRLRRLKENGTTMLLTTHYLEEASQLCDQLIIINHGNIIEQGAPAELIAKHVGRDAVELKVDPQFHPAILDWSIPWYKTHQRIDDNLVVYSTQGDQLFKYLTSQFAAQHMPVKFQRLRPTHLEDVFFILTGETLDSSSEPDENDDEEINKVIDTETDKEIEKEIDKEKSAGDAHE